MQYILIGSGRATVTINNTQTSVADPAVIAVPAGCIHAFEFQTNTEGYVLSICPKDNPLWGISSAHSDIAIAGICDREALIASDHLHAIRHRASPAAESLQLALIAQIKAHVQLLLEKQGNTHQHSVGLRLIQDFEDLIDKQLHERWSVARYATELCISPAHLNRVTRRNTGCTASHLIAMATARRAKSMLIHTSQTITEIAYALGYDDPPHFSRRFKQWTGFTPSALRRTML